MGAEFWFAMCAVKDSSGQQIYGGTKLDIISFSNVTSATDNSRRSGAETATRKVFMRKSRPFLSIVNNVIFKAPAKGTLFRC